MNTPYEKFYATRSNGEFVQSSVVCTFDDEYIQTVYLLMYSVDFIPFNLVNQKIDKHTEVGLNLLY